MPQKNTLIEVIFLYGAILKQALSQFEKVHIEYEYPLTLEFVHSQHHLFAENIEIELLWKFSLLKRVYFQKTSEKMKQEEGIIKHSIGTQRSCHKPKKHQ